MSPLTFAEALALSRRWYAVGLAGGARQDREAGHRVRVDPESGSPWAAASEGLGLRDRARRLAADSPATDA